MSNNEEIREDELEEEIIEEETDTEVVEETESEEVDQVDWKAEALKFKAIAERKAKQAEQVKKAEPKEKNINSTPSVEETVLRANGVSDDELDMLKKVAGMNESSLIDAQKDELYVEWKKKFDAEKKAEKASLGASRRSGQKAVKKDFSTPGLSPEEHKEMWKERRGIK